MKTLKDLIQGSKEWLEARLNYLCASEAPAVMGQSKYMTRSQLLDLKKGWQANPVSSFTQKLFDDGHEHEESARIITELEIFEDLAPVVGLTQIDELELLASFDGYSDSINWEHKDWNKTLAENVRNELLEPHYYWQLEHQCIVSGRDSVMFTCSDGTEQNRVSFVYQSVPERKEKLIAAWKQFVIDLDNHELVAKTEKVTANEIKPLPLIEYEMNGLALTSNFTQFKAAADQMVEEAKAPLESDQDFADAELRIKEFKNAEAKIKEVSEKVLGEVQSIDEFTKDLKYIAEQIRQARLATDKQVKSRKEEIKREIIMDAERELDALLDGIQSELKVTVKVDYKLIEQSIKGKKTVDSLKDAASTALAQLKTDANEQAAAVRANAALMKQPEYNEFKFLFSDWKEIAFKASDDFEALVKSRIADHKQAEEKRAAEAQKRLEAEAEAKAEAQREKIRLEEEAKARQKVNAEKTKTTKVKPEVSQPAATETKPVEQDNVALKKIALSLEIKGCMLGNDAKRLAKMIVDGEIPGVYVDLNQFKDAA